MDRRILQSSNSPSARSERSRFVWIYEKLSGLEVEGGTLVVGEECPLGAEGGVGENAKRLLINRAEQALDTLPYWYYCILKFIVQV